LKICRKGGCKGGPDKGNINSLKQNFFVVYSFYFFTGDVLDETIS